MILGFQCYSDPNGDIHVADGMVAQLKTGVYLPVGRGAEFNPDIGGRGMGYFRAVRGPGSGTFVGGSGRNLIATGLPIPASGPLPPVGIFRPGPPDFFSLGEFTLDVFGASSATISDGTDTVAILSAGGTAPVGDYDSTTYGETAYNASTPFTIAAAPEMSGIGAIQDCELTVNFGTAATGIFQASDAATRALVGDSDWTLIVNSDGTADLKHTGTIMATRAAGSDCSPEGRYDATEDGKTAYNSGDAWSAFVQVIPRLPAAGFVYLKITEAAGVLSAVEGPFFAASLPSPSGSDYYFAIAQCDGSAIEQYHTGLLVWPEP